MGWFKRKVSADKFGIALAEAFFLSAAEDSSSSLVQIAQEDHGIAPHIFLDELGFLRAFSIDFAITHALGGHTAKRNIVMDSFLSELSEAANTMSASGLNEGAMFMKSLNKRLIEYDHAVRKLDMTDPTSKLHVGKVFSRNCGCAENLRVSTLAVDLWVSAFKITHKVLESTTII